MKKIVLSVIFLLSLGFVSFLPVQAADETTSPDRTYSRVEDGADYLTPDEEDELRARLDYLSENRKMDVSIVTIESLRDYNSSRVEQLADSWYDNNHYGYGFDRDGILLLIAKKDRQWAMSTYGKGKKRFTKQVLDTIENSFRPSLSNGNYMRAFTSFANACDNALKFPALRYFLYSLIAGAVIAFFIVSSMKSKLKSVAFRKEAGEYEDKKSFHVETSKDIFMYTTLTRTPKPQNTGSHGGGHGGGHGGSHGSF